MLLLVSTPLIETPINDRGFVIVSGDAPTRDHILFSDFIDYPMLNPGRDKSWSIGTEHRQLRMYDVELSSPCEMRKMMLDNVARRHYIIDADVKVNKPWAGPKTHWKSTFSKWWE